MEEQSDLVAEEAFSVSTAVGWGTWRKISVPLTSKISDSVDRSAVDEQDTASVPWAIGVSGLFLKRMKRRRQATQLTQRAASTTYLSDRTLLLLSLSVASSLLCREKLMASTFLTF